MSTPVHLDPCPVCKSEARIHIADKDWYQIKCLKWDCCLATEPFPFRQDAVASWNGWCTFFRKQNEILPDMFLEHMKESGLLDRRPPRLVGDVV